MIPDERRKEIVRQVNKSDRVTVEELTEEFGVSEATIRRDLSSLAEDGLIERFHGGASRHQKKRPTGPARPITSTTRAASRQSLSGPSTS